MISVFKLSKRVCKKMMGAMMDFWWSNKLEGMGIRWCSQNRLTKRKDASGMGFKRFGDFE